MPEGDHANRHIDPEFVLDIKAYVSVEIGRCKTAIAKLLRLNQGAVVEFDRPASEPMDIRVNGALIAKGEVVVLNDKFGLRITDILSSEARIKRHS